MPHLGKFRKGWQNEQLAKFILSKFSFIAEPSTVSDDLGTDIFCTSFSIVNDRLYPKSSFSIQVKSKSAKSNLPISITNKADYLLNLGMPFFIGVVNQKQLTMSIYSGEAIPHFFTLYGNPLSINPDAKIFIKLVQTLNDGEYFCEQKGNKYYLNFYWVVDIPANYEYQKQSEKLEEFLKMCNILQDNISSKRNNEFLYSLYGMENFFYVYAGPGSAQVYMSNFFKRLAEVFKNLHWLYSTKRKQPDTLAAIRYDYKIFKNTYLNLQKRHKTSLPQYLQTLYNDAKELIERPGNKPIP